jgi:hypothetical protein
MFDIVVEAVAEPEDDNQIKVKKIREEERDGKHTQ